MNTTDIICKLCIPISSVDGVEFILICQLSLVANDKTSILHLKIKTYRWNPCQWWKMQAGCIFIRAVFIMSLKGVKRFDARQLVVDALAERKLLRGKKDHAMTLPICRWRNTHSICLSLCTFISLSLFIQSCFFAAIFHLVEINSFFKKYSTGKL